MEDINEKSALIVVDMQNDFIIGSLCIKNGHANEDPLEIVEPINKLIESNYFDLIIFTKDWHPDNHISFYENIHNSDRLLSEENKNPKCFDNVLFIKPFEYRQIIFPKHCVSNTYGAEIHSDIVIPKNSYFVNKGIDTFHDSFSGFFDNHKVNKTELENILKENNIKVVFVCGVAYEYCVSSTANDASDLGFKTYLIKDCTKGLDFDEMKKAKEKMNERAVIEITSSEIFHLNNDS
ncbi:Isochorismatase-like domain-containing protein [Strongyloides ratti]|uniref:nicotinamidase n=1 Tax=Strongyloides ratti TaxID=34506 RepID=A0A090MV57_STRRB|nr:Isochorismatase-like domain-containing protein [Strongyloides ratti]CEF62658.1 Isochorismatase-like domain-containing protein [Strongyloides ratti]